MKRWREPKAKPGELKAQWGKVEGDLDIAYAWGAGVDRSDARLLNTVIANDRFRPSFTGPFGTYEKEHSFIAELEARGYDITTLKFSIQKKH